MRAIRIERYDGPEFLRRVDISGRYTLDEVGIAHAALEERRQLGESSAPDHCLGPAWSIDLLPLQGMGG